MTATALGLLLFAERLGAPQTAGAALLLAGMCLTATATARTAPAP